MKSDSEDEIFGEQVKPTPSPLSRQFFHTFDDDLLEKQQQIISEIRISEEINEKNIKQENSLKNLKSLHTSYTYFKAKQRSVAFTGVSNKSSELEKEENKKDKKLKIKELQASDVFQCQECLSDAFPAKCELCKGKLKIKGDNNLLKFFQYVMEFKLGNKEDYKSKKYNQKPNKLCTDFFSSTQLNRNSMPMSLQNSMNLQQFKEKCSIKSTIHNGYQCDHCEIQPIRGTRYHCRDPDCQNDYDLCEECYFRIGHRHQMLKIRQNGIQKQVESVTNFINESTRGIQRSSINQNYLKPPKSKAQERKTYFSSIH